MARGGFRTVRSGQNFFKMLTNRSAKQQRRRNGRLKSETKRMWNSNLRSFSGISMAEMGNSKPSPRHFLSLQALKAVYLLPLGSIKSAYVITESPGQMSLQFLQAVFEVPRYNQ